MAANGHETITSSCRCLNIRIKPQPGADTPPYTVSVDSDFTPIFVGDEGIFVAHPQVTLRTRSKPVPIGDTSRCTRYTSSTCLICQVLVYRVHQVVPLDVEGKDGPLLPTNEWVEKEILKSPTGWIEVHKSSLNNDAFEVAMSSGSYSPTFSLILPPRPSPSIRSDIQLNDGRSSHSGASNSPPPLGPYLSHLRPLFPPAPFTPSHPVFVHLSSIATAKSQEIRSAAEERLIQAVMHEAEATEEAEHELKREVEILWKKFRESVDEQRSQHAAARSGRRDSDAWSGTTVGENSLKHGTVAIRDFVPMRSAVARSPPPIAIPRMSSLSASLVTSSFHHPRERTSQQASSSRVTPPSDRSPPAYVSNPSSPASSLGQSLSSPSTSSSQSMSVSAAVDGSIILAPFKRSMDQKRDAATSFRYFTIEAEMEKAALAKKQQEAGAAAGLIQQPMQSDLGEAKRETSANGLKTRPKDKASSLSERAERSMSAAATNTIEGSGASKGKRKVTFDVKPDIVTIKREVEAEKKAESAGRNSEEMVFDLEPEDSDRLLSASEDMPALTLREQAPAPLRDPRTRTSRRTISDGSLPESFSSLRPVSLPAPSHVRPPRPPPPEPARPLIPKLPTSKKEKRRSLPDVREGIDPFDEREAEILKLVAANTPSHRGAWKRDSKAWEMFVRRQGGRTSHPLIPEEGEEDGEGVEDDEDTDEDNKWTQFSPIALAGSLPIAIGPLSQTRPVLSLASYQPKTSLVDNIGGLVPPGRIVSSSTALRKAAYAERDRSRSFDPGALDFEAEIDEGDEVSDDDSSKTDPPEIGEKGRKRALKILQARSELPEAGMWRSLAN